MSRILDPRWGLSLVLVIGVALPAAWGQKEKPDQPVQVERMLIRLKSAEAKDLAPLITQHMKRPDVQVLPEPNSNSLLVSAPAGHLKEVVELINELDVAPPVAQVLAVEVLIADVVAAPAKGGTDKPPVKEIDESELQGPIDAVLKKIDALKKEGRLGSLKRFQFSALENQPIRSMVGEMKPYTTGSSVRPGGFASNMINYRDIGTLINVTARVGANKTANLDLKIEDTRMIQPEDGVQLGTTDKGTPIMATEFVNSQVTTKVNVPLGEAAVVSGVKTTAKSQSAQTLVIVTVRAEGSKKGN